jgi:hypothetical protein
VSPNCTIVFGQNLVFQHKFCQDFVDFGTANPNFVVLHKKEEEEEEKSFLSPIHSLLKKKKKKE